MVAGDSSKQSRANGVQQLPGPISSGTAIGEVVVTFFLDPSRLSKWPGRWRSQTCSVSRAAGEGREAHQFGMLRSRRLYARLEVTLRRLVQPCTCPGTAEGARDWIGTRCAHWSNPCPSLLVLPST